MRSRAIRATLSVAAGAAATGAFVATASDTPKVKLAGRKKSDPVAFFDLDHTIIDANSNKHWVQREFQNGKVHPIPYTLHPTLGALHPTPCALHATPCALLPTPYPTPYTSHATFYTLSPTPSTQTSKPYTLHPTPYTLHPTPYTLHPTP